jgi:hypothetical protein
MQRYTLVTMWCVLQSNWVMSLLEELWCMVSTRLTSLQHHACVELCVSRTLVSKWKTHRVLPIRLQCLSPHSHGGHMYLHPTRCIAKPIRQHSCASSRLKGVPLPRRGMVCRAWQVEGPESTQNASSGHPIRVGFLGRKSYR